MGLLDTFLLGAILVVASAVLVAVKSGFNQAVAALQAIHDQLQKLPRE